MSIKRINEFQAKAGKGKELHELLGSIINRILAAEGCLSCELLSAMDSPSKFVIIEEWASVELHQKAAQLIPKDTMKTAMELFDSPPGGTYYNM